MSRYIILAICLLAEPAWTAVDVYVEQVSGAACIRYQCTAGEVVRAWALDVSVDQGRIVGVSEFFRGECTTLTQGYGIFPAAFRDHITVGPGTNINWSATEYTPLAVVADNPGDTLPGLGSGGVTLEFGALWDPSVPTAAPESSGTLCALQLSEGAHVSVAANVGRGGVVAAVPDMILAPEFTGLFVQPPELISVTMSNDQVIVTFAGGELETASTPHGTWIPTGNTSGTQMEPAVEMRFYRVRALSSLPPPEITGIRITNDLVTITFTGGELEAAATPSGTWTATGNTSGELTEAMVGMRFYRVRGP